MIEELKQLLETAYQEGINAQQEDDPKAKTARESGDMPAYFDLSLRLQLADTCWALEKWDEAKRWYRHNTRVMKERRALYAKDASLSESLDGISDWEAATFVKAGDLEAAREILPRAVKYWRSEPNSELPLTMLGLHAAQAGLPELTAHVSHIVEARQQLPGAEGKTAGQARKLLHYEFAQAHLLMGRWDDFLNALEEFKKGAALADRSSEPVFPEPLQNALLAASHGLETIAALHSGAVESETGWRDARQAFEQAMLHFYQFGGQVDWDIYFMRLNSRLAENLADGHPLNVNPFAR